MILMYVLSCLITVGNLQFKQVEGVTVFTTVNELTNTAQIRLPKTLSFPNGSEANVSDRIKKGQTVKIELGYNGDNNLEFEGYLSTFDLTIPIVLNCEDEMYQLKQNPVSPKTWEKASLSDVVGYVTKGYKVNYIDANINLGYYQIGNDTSPARVLQDIKQVYGISFQFKGKVLQAGFPFDINPTTNSYVYDFQRNVAESNLEYKTTTDYKLKIKAISHLNNGKTLTVWYPSKDDEGDVYVMNFPELTAADLTKQAKEYLAKINFDGYRGTVTGFGIPFLQAGDAIYLRNALFPEGNAKYLIQSVLVTFGRGYRRECTPSKRIST
jgi:hypothetical protein